MKWENIFQTQGSQIFILVILKKFQLTFTGWISLYRILRGRQFSLIQQKFRMYQNVVFATCHNKTNFFHFEDEDFLKVEIVFFPGTIKYRTENA